MTKLEILQTQVEKIRELFSVSIEVTIGDSEYGLFRVVIEKVENVCDTFDRVLYYLWGFRDSMKILLQNKDVS